MRKIKLSLMAASILLTNKLPEVDTSLIKFVSRRN